MWQDRRPSRFDAHPLSQNDERESIAVNASSRRSRRAHIISAGLFTIQGIELVHAHAKALAQKVCLRTWDRTAVGERVELAFRVATS